MQKTPFFTQNAIFHVIEDAMCGLSCYTSIGRKFPCKHGHAENRAGISADSHNLRLKWPGTMEIFAVIDFSRPCGTGADARVHVIPRRRGRKRSEM